MIKILEKFKQKKGAILSIATLAILLVGCKSEDDFSKYDKTTGENFFRVKSIPFTDADLLQEGYGDMYLFNFPYVYSADDKACNDSALFIDCGAPILSVFEVSNGELEQVGESTPAELAFDGLNVVSLKAKNNSFAFALDAEDELESFEMKEGDATKILLEGCKIKQIDKVVFETDTKKFKKFVYPVGLEIYDSVEVQADKSEKHIQVVKSVKTDNAFLLESTAPYDSVFCVVNNSLRTASYYQWGWDSLEIKGKKDTSVVESEAVVLDEKNKEPLKSLVDESKDSVLVTMKDIQLPLLITNWEGGAEDKWKDLVFEPVVVKSEVKDADSVLVDTILKVTWNATDKKLDTLKVPNPLRSKVYEYYILARYPRLVLKTTIDFYNAYSKSNPVQYLKEVTVEEIAYSPNKKSEGQTYNGATSKNVKKSHKYYSVAVNFESHVVTKK